ncbi:hypothetical protein [Sulfitobacter mediterraneus]|uniref:hypothetical protein n=1 Tax=Sulfitobacter mediterraneus TaxID=83219 RepID=UPI0021A67D00|nr:hypothetical protein [Sulfitobacter mediterraneus]UWR10951.1 hypothetical protein K3753_17130 [Sulfitobacter mediterraneus]
MNPIKSRIAKLEGNHVQSNRADPVILSWDEDPNDPRNWACGWPDGPAGKTIVKRDDETRGAFAARISANTTAGKAGIQ